MEDPLLTCMVALWQQDDMETLGLILLSHFPRRMDNASYFDEALFSGNKTFETILPFFTSPLSFDEIWEHTIHICVQKHTNNTPLTIVSGQSANLNKTVERIQRAFQPNTVVANTDASQISVLELNNDCRDQVIAFLVEQKICMSKKHTFSTDENNTYVYVH